MEIKPLAQIGRQSRRPFGKVSMVAAIQAQGLEVRGGLALPVAFPGDCG